MPSAPEETDEAKRTDPKTFLANGLQVARSMVLPLLALFYTIRSDGAPLAVLLGIGVALLLAFFALAYVQWYRFTYHVGAEDIRVESGVLARQARAVPYERIQDVSIEQSLIPRLLGLVEVRFETGAGGKDELKLTYLAEKEGERLRELVRERRDGTADTAPVGGEENDGPADEGAPLFAMDTRRVLTFGMFEFSLVVVAAVFAGAQQFEVLLPFDMFDFEEWQRLLAGPGAWLAGLGFAAQVIGAFIAAASLLVIGFATGLIRTALREWGFTLHRTAKGFRRRRGLLTRTDVVMPVHRVQALEIATGFLRRWFGWHSLKLVSLAQDSGNASHVAAPFAKMGEIEPIVREAGFVTPPPELEWQRSSRRFGVDSAVFAGLLFAVIAALLAGLSAAGVFARLDLFIPDVVYIVLVSGAVLFTAEQWILWRKRRHALGDRQLYSAHGVLSPKLDIASRRKLQSVEIAQGPLSRLRGYASLKLGLAGGTLSIEGLPLERARELRRALLASMTESDFSELA
ncbi:PH domain-containing protein [Qipengyuania atrilutea]|uniref:PH domain-containing protein n=1 Tax=Qipengyuania atrilutea TaxID=2744473 RepID=A0A850H5L6_9SPHN|nr:PH domain-containing protein [Actirhodobacter atriluteus]NVD45143.1 PH domain-containing protein [Actirhodobacter atriluteus]